MNKRWNIRICRINDNLFNNFMFLKTIATLTLIFFLYTFVFFEPVFGISKLIEEKKIEAKLKNVFKKERKTFIPLKYGYIVDGGFVNENKLVVIIQDLHCHREVQKNIYEIVKLLDRKFGIAKIFVEGAPREKVQPTLFSTIPSNIRGRVLENLLNKGMIGAAEYYVIQENKSELYGLEDWEIYIQNLYRLRQLIKRKHMYKQITLKLKNRFKKLRKYLSKDIKQVENTFNKIKIAEKTVKDFRFLNYLVKILYNYGIGLNNYPNLRYYIEILLLSKQIDFKKLNVEIKQYLRDLETKLSFSEYDSLMKKLSQDSDEFYQELSLIYDSTVSDKEKFPNLDRFIKYINRARWLNPYILTWELRQLEEDVISKLSKKTVDKEILFISKMVNYLQEYVNLNITEEEFKFLNKHIPVFKPYLSKYFYNDPKLLKDIQNILEDRVLSDFYLTNIKRNEIMVNSVISQLLDNKAVFLENVKLSKGTYHDVVNRINEFKEISVVIVGGFHSKISEYLLKRGISTLVIMPNASKKYDEKIYDLMFTKQIGFDAFIRAAFAPYLLSICDDGQVLTFYAMLEAVIQQLSSGGDISSAIGELNQWLKVNNISSIEIIEIDKSQFQINVNDQKILIYSKNGKIRTKIIKERPQKRQSVSVHRYSVISQLIKSFYKFLISDPKFLDILYQESINPNNDEETREVYKSVYNYYKELEEYSKRIKTKRGVFLKFFQIEGVRFILENKRVLLADEMGLGKTVQTIVAAENASRSDGKPLQRILVIAPNVAVENWRREILRFSYTGEEQILTIKKIRSIISSVKRRNAGRSEEEIIEEIRKEIRRELNSAKYVVLNYEAIRGEDNLLRRILLEERFFDMIVVDEAHNVSNRRTLQAQAITEFEAEYKVLLTGTPFRARNIGPMYNLLKWLDSVVFTEDEKEFSKRMRTQREALYYELEEKGKMLRRTRTDVMPYLPKISFIEEELSFTEGYVDQARIYEAVKASLGGTLRVTTALRQAVVHGGLLAYDYYLYFEDGLTVPILHNMNYVEINGEKYEIQRLFVGASKETRLKNVSSGEEIILTPQVREIKLNNKSVRIEARRAKIPSVVYDRVVDLVKEKVNRGEKVVIFTEFVAVAKDLLDVLSSNGINAAIITGDTTSIEREQNLRAFSDRKSPLKVLIVTRPVVSEAVNLTSANNVIFVNSPWTYQQVQQALSRVYRMGQEKDVMVYFINVAGTVTASQKRNIEQTKSIFESVFAPPNVKVKELLQNLVVRRRSEIQGKPLITISKRPSTLVENCELSVEVSEDAREINATLTVSEGKSVTINGWKNFVDAFLGRLSKESKEYLREFVILRTASEIQSRISIKDMFLWKLLSIFQPEINFKDYDGSIVSIIPKAVYFIYAIINDMTVEEMQRSFQMTEEDMKEVLNYLVKTGLLIKLSKIGLFEFDKVDTIVKQFNIRMGGINVGMDDNELSHDKFGAIIGYERIKLAKGLRKRNVFIKIDNEKLVRAIVDGDNIYFENTFLDILRKVHRLLKRKLQFYNEMVAEEREEIAIYENKMIDRFIRSLQLQLPPTKLTERIIELEEYLYSISEQVEDYFVKKLIDEIQGVLQILKQNPSVLEEYADMLILKLRELENKLPINLRVSVSPLSAIISAIAGLTVRFLTNERGESSVVDSVVIYWDSINIDASGNAEVEVMLVENSDAELRILSSDEVDKIIPRSQMMAILSMYGIKNVKINAKVIGKDRLKFNPQLLTRTILAGLPVWGLDYADPSCLASISLRNAWNFAFDLVKEAQKIYQANEDLAKRKLILAARILNNFCLEPEERISVRDEIVYNPDIKFCFDKIIEMLKIVALRYQYEVEEQHSGESKQGFGGIVFGDLRSIMSRLLGIPVSEVTQQKVIKYLESNVVSVDKEDLEIILRSGESALGVWQPEKIFINRRIRIGYDRIGRPIWITIKPVNAENMIISADESIPVLVTRVDSLSFDIYIPSIFLDEEKMDTSIVSRILSHVIQYQVLVAANNPDMTLEELRNIDSVEWNKERTIWYGKEKRKLPSLKADVKQQIYCWLNNMRYLSDEKMSIFVRTIQAFAQFCNSHESASVLVGGFKDTLIASEIIAGNGIDVTLVEQPVSLAEIQYMMRQGKYNFGVYITADGAILFLGSKGELLDRNTLKVIEKISKVVSKAKYMDYKIAEDIGRLKILREIGMHERFSGLLKASFPQQQVVVIDEDTLNLLKRTGVYNGVSPYIRGYTRDIPQFLRKTGVQDRKCIGMRITGQGVEYYDIDGRKILEDDLCIALVYYAYRYIGYRGNIRKNIITTSIVDTLVELLGGKIDGIDPISSDLTGDLRSKVATTDANNEIFSMNDNLIDYFKVALLLNSIISEKGSVYNLINEARRFLQEQGKISEMYSYERIGRKTEMELLQILSEDSIDELINLIEKETKKKVTEIFKGWKNAIKIDLDDGSFIIFRIEDGVTKVYVHSPNHRLNKSIAKKVLNWYYRKSSITVRSKELLISTIISILLFLSFMSVIALIIIQPAWLVNLIIGNVFVEIIVGIVGIIIPRFIINTVLISLIVGAVPLLLYSMIFTNLFSYLTKAASKEGTSSKGLSYHLASLPTISDTIGKSMDGEPELIKLLDEVPYIKKFIFERVPRILQPLFFTYYYYVTILKKTLLFKGLIEDESGRLTFRMGPRWFILQLLKASSAPILAIMMLRWYITGKEPWLVKPLSRRKISVPVLTTLRNLIIRHNEDFYIYSVRITEANDGDGFVVKVDKDRTIKYRLLGIDVVEQTDENIDIAMRAIAAKEILDRLVKGKEAIILVSKQDISAGYGRIGCYAYVYDDQLGCWVNVNRWLPILLEHGDFDFKYGPLESSLPLFIESSSVVDDFKNRSLFSRFVDFLVRVFKIKKRKAEFFNLSESSIVTDDHWTREELINIGLKISPNSDVRISKKARIKGNIIINDNSSFVCIGENVELGECLQIGPSAKVTIITDDMPDSSVIIGRDVRINANFKIISEFGGKVEIKDGVKIDRDLIIHTRPHQTVVIEMKNGELSISYRENFEVGDILLEASHKGLSKEMARRLYEEGVIDRELLSVIELWSDETSGYQTVNIDGKPNYVNFLRENRLTEIRFDDLTIEERQKLIDTLMTKLKETVNTPWIFRMLSFFRREVDLSAEVAALVNFSRQIRNLFPTTELEGAIRPLRAISFAIDMVRYPSKLECLLIVDRNSYEELKQYGVIDNGSYLEIDFNALVRIARRVLPHSFVEQQFDLQNLQNKNMRIYVLEESQLSVENSEKDRLMTQFMLGGVTFYGRNYTKVSQVNEIAAWSKRKQKVTKNFYLWINSLINEAEEYLKKGNIEQVKKVLSILLYAVKYVVRGIDTKEFALIEEDFNHGRYENVISSCRSFLLPALLRIGRTLYLRDIARRVVRKTLREKNWENTGGILSGIVDGLVLPTVEMKPVEFYQDSLRNLILKMSKSVPMSGWQYRRFSSITIGKDVRIDLPPSVKFPHGKEVIVHLKVVNDANFGDIGQVEYDSTGSTERYIITLHALMFELDFRVQEMILQSLFDQILLSQGNGKALGWAKNEVVKGLQQKYSYNDRSDFNNIIYSIRKYNNGIRRFTIGMHPVILESGKFSLPTGVTMKEYARQIAQGVSDYLNFYVRTTKQQKVGPVRVCYATPAVLEIANDFVNVLVSNDIEVSDKEYIFTVIIAPTAIFIVDNAGNIISQETLQMIEFISSHENQYFYNVDRKEMYQSVKWDGQLPEARNYKETFRWGETTPLSLRLKSFLILLFSSIVLGLILLNISIFLSNTFLTVAVASYLGSTILKIPLILQIFATFVPLLIVSVLRYTILKNIRRSYYEKGEPTTYDVDALPELEKVGKAEVSFPKGQYRYVQMRADGLLKVDRRIYNMPRWLAAVVFTDDVIRAQFDQNIFISSVEYDRTLFTLGRVGIILRILLFEPVITLLATWRAFETLFSRGGLLLETEVAKASISTFLPENLTEKYEPVICSFDVSQSSLRSGKLKLGQIEYDISSFIPRGSDIHISLLGERLKGAKVLLLVDRQATIRDSDYSKIAYCYVLDENLSNDEYDTWTLLPCYLYETMLFDRRETDHRGRIRYYTLQDIGSFYNGSIPAFIRVPKINILDSDTSAKDNTVFRYLDPVIDAILLVLNLFYSLRIIFRAPFRGVVDAFLVTLPLAISNGNWTILQSFGSKVGVMLLSLAVIYFIAQIATSAMVKLFYSTARWRYKNLPKKLNILLEKIVGPIISLIAFRMANHLVAEVRGFWKEHVSVAQIHHFLEVLSKKDDVTGLSLGIANLHRLVISRIEQVNGEGRIDESLLTLDERFFDNKTLEDIKNDLVSTGDIRQGYIYILAEELEKIAHHYGMQTSIKEEILTQFVPKIQEATSISELKLIVESLFLEIFIKIDEITAYYIEHRGSEIKKQLGYDDDIQFTDSKLALIRHHQELSEKLRELPGITFDINKFESIIVDIDHVSDWQTLERYLIEYAEAIEKMFPEYVVYNDSLVKNVTLILSANDGQTAIMLALETIDGKLDRWSEIMGEPVLMRTLEIQYVQSLSKDIRLDNISSVNAALLHLLGLETQNHFDGVESEQGIRRAILATAKDISQVLGIDVYQYISEILKENKPNNVIDDEMVVYQKLCSFVLARLWVRPYEIDVVGVYNEEQLVLEALKKTIAFHREKTIENLVLMNPAIDPNTVFSQSSELLRTARDWNDLRAALIKYADEINQVLPPLPGERVTLSQSVSGRVLLMTEPTGLLKIFEIIDDYIYTHTYPQELIPATDEFHMLLRELQKAQSRTLPITPENIASINNLLVRALALSPQQSYEINNHFIGMGNSESELRTAISATVEELKDFLGERDVNYIKQMLDVNAPGTTVDEMEIYRLLLGMVLKHFKINITGIDARTNTEYMQEVLEKNLEDVQRIIEYQHLQATLHSIEAYKSSVFYRLNLSPEHFTASQQKFECARDWGDVKLALIEFARDLEKFLPPSASDLDTQVAQILVNYNQYNETALQRVFALIDQAIDLNSPEAQIIYFSKLLDNSDDIREIHRGFYELLSYLRGERIVYDDSLERISLQDEEKLRMTIFEIAKQLDQQLGTGNAIYLETVGYANRVGEWSGKIYDEELIYKHMMKTALEILRAQYSVGDETSEFRGLTSKVFGQPSEESFQSFVVMMNDLDFYIKNILRMRIGNLEHEIRFIPPQTHTVEDLAKSTKNYFIAIYSYLGLDVSKVCIRFDSVDSMADLYRMVNDTVRELQISLNVETATYTFLPSEFRVGYIRSMSQDSVSDSVTQMEQLLSYYSGTRVEITTQIRGDDIVALKNSVHSLAVEISHTLDRIVEGRFQTSFDEKAFIQRIDNALDKATTTEEVLQVYNTYLIYGTQSILDDAIIRYISSGLGGYNPYGDKDFVLQIHSDLEHIYDNLVLMGMHPSISKEEFLRQGTEYLSEVELDKTLVFNQNLNYFARFLWTYLSPVVNRYGLNYNEADLLNFDVRQGGVQNYNLLMSKISVIFKSSVTISRNIDLIHGFDFRGNIDRIETISSYLNAMNYLIYLTLSELCNENDVVVSELERMKTVRLPSSLTVQDLKLWIENIDKVLSLALDDRSYQDGSIVNMFEEVSDTSDPSLLKMKLESVLQVVMRSIANEAKLRGQSERNLLSETLQRLSEHSSTLAVAQFTFKREQPQQKPVVKTVSGNILKIIGSIVKSISNLFVFSFHGSWLFLVLSTPRILLKVFVFIASHGWGPFKIKRGLIKEFREAAKLNITPSPLNDFTIGICSLTRNGEYVFAIVEDVMERLPLVVQRFAKNLMIAEFQISQIRNKLIWKLLTLPLYIPIFYGVVTSVIALVVTVGELVGDLIKSRVNITFNMWIKRIAIASLLILTMIGSYVLAGLRLSSLANNTISPTPLPTPTPIVISTEESPTFESPLLTPDIVKEEGSDKPLQKDDLAHQFNLTPVFQHGNTVLYGLENGRLGYYSNVNGIGIFFTSPSDTVISKEVLVETVLISDIKNARERIDIAIYGLNRESIVSALEFALKNGIEVRIVCDADSTGEYWREYGRYFDRLMKAGAQVVSVNSAGIMHNKLIIIDDEIVWTGSMNLTDNCMTKNANVFYRIVSKEMAGILSHEFEQLFSQRSGYGKLDVTPEKPINVNGVEIKILISPYDDFIRAMSHEIITTKGKIHFAIFALSEPQVTEAIRVSSAEEKIGLIDGTLKEQDWYTDEGLSTEVEILPEGWLGKMHLKLMILDGKTVITGSANWTRSAQVRNDEIMFIIENEDFAKVHELYFKILYRELTGKELSQSEISKQFVRAKGNIGLFSLGVIGDGGLFILRKRKPRRIYRRKMRKSIVTSLRSACNPMWPAQVVSRQVLPELHQYLKRTSPELEGGTVFYVTPYLVSYLLSNEMDGFSTINELGMNTVGIGLLWKGMWVKKGVQVEFQRIDYSRLNLKKVGTILVPMYGKEEEVSVYAVSFNGSLLIFLELPEVTAIMEPSNIQMLEKQMLLLGRGSLCLIKELADGNPSLMEGLASLRIPVKQFRPVVVQGDGIIASTFLNPRTVRDSLQSGVLNKLVYVSTIRSDEEDLEISLDRLSEIGVAPQILNDYGIVGDGKIKCSDICMLYNQQVANTGRSKREHITSTLKFRNLICGGIRLSRWQHRDFKELLRKDYNRDNVRAMMSIHKTAKRNFIDWIQHKTGNILNSDNLFLVVDPMASQINFSDAFVLAMQNSELREEFIRSQITIVFFDNSVFSKDSSTTLRKLKALSCGRIIEIDEFGNEVLIDYEPRLIGRILFIENFEHKELTMVYQGADMVCTSSVSELESGYMKCLCNGVPVLYTTSVDSSENIISYYNGIFIKKDRHMISPKDVIKTLIGVSQAYYTSMREIKRGKWDVMWCRMMWNALQTSSKVDIVSVVKDYIEKLWYPAYKIQQSYLVEEIDGKESIGNVTNGINLSMSLPLSALRNGRYNPGIGKLTDLIDVFRETLKPAGISIVILLPHYAQLERNPYLPISVYSISPDYIDWVEEARRLGLSEEKIKEILSQLDLPVDDKVHYDLVRIKEKEIAKYCYEIFKRRRDDEYEDFKKTNSFWLDDYAKFMVAKERLGRNPSSKEEIEESIRSVDQDELEKWIYIQYVAYTQLKKTIDYIHAHGGKVIFDIPFFRSRGSIDTIVRLEYFRTESPSINGKVLPELVLYNWEQEGVKRLIIEPIMHWLFYGFDGVRVDYFNLDEISKGVSSDTVQGYDTEREEFVAELVSEVRKISRDSIIIIETNKPEHVDRHLRQKYGIYTVVYLKDIDKIEKVAKDGLWLFFTQPESRLQTDSEIVSKYGIDSTSLETEQESIENLIDKVISSGVSMINFNLGDFEGDLRPMSDSSWEYRMPLPVDFNKRFDLKDFVKRCLITAEAKTEDTYYREGYSVGKNLTLREVAFRTILKGLHIPENFVIRNAEGETLCSITSPSLHVLLDAYRYTRSLSEGRSCVVYHCSNNEFFVKTKEILLKMGLTEVEAPEVWRYISFLERKAELSNNTEIKIKYNIMLLGFLQGLIENVLYNDYVTRTGVEINEEQDVFTKLLVATDSFIITEDGNLSSLYIQENHEKPSKSYDRSLLINLFGLLIVSGKYGEAKSLLEKFATEIFDGSKIILDKIYESKQSDTPLWFVEVLYRYYERTGDREFIKKMLPLVNKILEIYTTADSSRGIYLDRDNLVIVPTGWTWTEGVRGGKPIEIQALLYNALMIGAEFNREFGLHENFDTYRDMARKIKTAIREKFFGDNRDYPFDVIDGDIYQDSIRPNALMLISLSHVDDLVTQKQRDKILEIVETELLTPYGLRTLSSLDRNYGKKVSNRFVELDGEICPWLIALYIRAKIRQMKDLPIEQIRQHIRPLVNNLKWYIIQEGTLPSRFSSSAPYSSGGFISSAWSVAALMEVVDLVDNQPRLKPLISARDIKELLNIKTVRKLLSAS